MKKKLKLQWTGSFIELCMARVTPDQQQAMESRLANMDADIESAWYTNAELLKAHFDAANWWSIDDLDHVMGLVFKNRQELDAKMAAIAFEIDGIPLTVDPDAIQLSFYAPEAIEEGSRNERILCHGARREAIVQLTADVEPPFDPSLITLSLLRYPDYGFILIDLDYDGHDDVQFTFGETTYLKPLYLGKESIDDASR